MDLYLIRHGTYSRAYIDPEEGLSAVGVAEVSKMVPHIHTPIQSILSSPKTRAKQTAAILAEHLGHPEIVYTDHLKPSADLESALSAITSYDHSLLIVSHLPLIQEITLELTGKHVEFNPATLVHVQMPDGKLLATHSP